MKTQVLYPSSYPIDQSINYWYFESPPPSDYLSEALKLIQGYHVFIDIEIPVTGHEIIRMNLKVHRKLDSSNTFLTQYTVQYEDKRNNTIIRADNNHPYPHIDLQLPNKNKEKRIFDTDPSDYEASINTVLRYSEFYNNPTIGIDYWLLNLTAFKRELIYSYFKSSRRFLSTSTALTDVARLVSLEILTSSDEIIYEDQKLARTIANNFIKCRMFEEEYKRPLKISKNLIQVGIQENLFPCMIFADNSVPIISKIFDNDGNELPATGSYFPLGKTTFHHKA